MNARTYATVLRDALATAGCGHVCADAMLERARARGIREIPGVISAPTARAGYRGGGTLGHVEYHLHYEKLPELAALVRELMADPPPRAA